MAKLSIVTPTYDRAALLKRCFRSLLQQTSSNFEWIIIDDGSKDDTQDVIRSFLDEPHRFAVIPVYKENGGKHTALNVSIPISAGTMY